MVANTNLTTHPIGESPIAQFITYRQCAHTVSNTVRNIGVSPSGKAQDFDSCIPLVRVQPPQPYGEVILMVRKQFAKLLVAGKRCVSSSLTLAASNLIAIIRYLK